MRVVCIVQARLGSSRLPGKVLKKIENVPIIHILLKRLENSKKIDQIIVATPDTVKDKPLHDFLKNINYEFIKGSESNVLNRFVKASKKYNADVVVRITGDCPLVDPALVDFMIEQFKVKNVDYLTNTLPPTYPDGLDIEVFSSKALYESSKLTKNDNDLEHVTPFIRNSKKYTKYNISHDVNLSEMRWTLDEKEDLNVIRNIFKYFSPKIDFSWEDVLNLFTIEPKLFEDNNLYKRNEGSSMGKGQKLYKKAKNLIPGGNMLLSKRPEMFLPDIWPSYFSKTKGCHVWDLDGKKYTDMSIMGIGTNILGYGNKEVDEAVAEVISKGNMSSLNCPEEVYLAEKLIEINPWSDMVRLARSGGEANAIAIRIARAATGKDQVAICGYHGWHDWYLSANLGDKSNLDSLLLPGLEPAGVPKNLEGTVLPFKYNDYEYLETLVKNSNIGVIKMEVMRNDEPQNNFLSKVRDLANKHGIVLIFDECTSGFRETFGGLHKKFDVEPDMAMYGKALGNGYAITAIVGKKEIMEAAQSSFLSSTFWTERIGPSAALKTLQIMEIKRSWDEISQTGKSIKEDWRSLANKHDLDIHITGLSALPSFSFKTDDNLKYKTFITQEMLKKGYLAAMSVYVCTEHTEQIIKGYMFELDKIFKKIKEFEDGDNIDNYLEGPVCHSGFSRLN